ncbi:ubiquinol-cytochrome c reductase iron-sulfur subunit [Herminiimonas contaminans]|uniref:Ubiquinol-cytochrome c reductase iron-sulfur subunit n=1 Tax=Herminiimonas contaminans TaxID=1111140 RepID=A0ABS0EXR9_9BURK|nr:ubiquinol-cytochrome c reductase iron-sulfur subunit [Herminiimonas contaminans]MBF8179637.1 ubiquinol-cytochrome c reductase iron-sulfur subunit [Herminiimonas contaminans]
MDNRETDTRRRKFLTAATTGVGGVGLVAASIPFVQSMSPSEAAKAAGAPVEVDLGRVKPGTLLTVEWCGKPVWIVHRTDRMPDLLGRHGNQLVDPQSKEAQQPEYAKNATRSIRSPYLVVIGICTHLGCIPIYRPEMAPADLGPDWPGGFYCPCHGSKFDLAGRVFKNVPAPRNLEVPPYTYVSDTRLLIGKDDKTV